jgi:pimeloyl-ACP methyl ester carboxylesterase
VRRLLQRQGHEVFTPTLTGLADRSHLLSAGIDLDTHILDVQNLVKWEELDDFVLCGHSYAGMVVSGVADRIPERIRALVFLDAFVPEDGECLADFAPVSGGELMDGWKSAPISAEAFGDNPDDRPWVDRQCTVQSVGCFQQRIRLAGGIERIARIGYLYATGWAGGQSLFAPFRARAQSRRWDTRDIDCGHDVMIDRPVEVAALLGEYGGAQPGAR